MYRGVPILFLFVSFGLWAQQDNQTRVFAAARAERISALDYQLRFELERDLETYRGKARLRFELTSARDDLVVDFDGDSIVSLSVDGKALKSYGFQPEQGRITVPAEALAIGKVNLAIDFIGRTVNNGQGLHRFVDPTDGLVYLYTHFEPNDAHRLFPCFDQPDIKGSFSVEVLAPNDWTIVGNGAPVMALREGNRTRTRLKKTKPFSTYIFQLSAGPYAVWRDGAFRYPLALYARQSLAKHVDAARFLEATRKGFDFFEAYFDTAYPFEKYDQLFVPEFNIGAMENVAAVTFTERYIFHSKPTERRLLRRDLTLFHEMAHMWFGDLVTMAWWNDLWLKESFATYMSYLAAAGTGVAEAWTLSAGSKDSALRQDQLITTHPILAEVSDVRAAASIFDGITYGKGFAVLRQLDYYLGGNVFRDGCRRYFKEHAWGVTTLDDFIEAMETVYGKPLDEWVAQWLATSDVNTIELAYRSSRGRIEGAVLRQYPGRANKVVRTHAADFALFYDKGGQALAGPPLRVVYRGSETALEELDGKPEPVLVLPNYSDHDYVKVRLDTASLTWARENIDRLADGAVRTTLWRILWDMVRDAQLSAKLYLELGMEVLARERDPAISERVLGRMRLIVDSFIPDEDERERRRKMLYDFVSEHLATQAQGSDLQRAWYGTLVGLSEKDDELNLLIQVLEGSKTWQGLELDSMDRWRLVGVLTSFGHKRAGEMAERVGTDDQSAYAKGYRLYLEAVRPNRDAKEKAWRRVTEGSYSLRETFQIARGILVQGQEELAEPFLDRFFSTLPKLWQEREWVFVSRFVGFLFPVYGKEKTLQAAQRFLERQDLDQTLRNLVLEEVDSLQRTLKIRAAWSPSLEG